MGIKAVVVVLLSVVALQACGTPVNHTTASGKVRIFPILCL